MRSSLYLCVISILLASATSTRAQLINGSFETPVLSPNTFITPAPGSEPSGFGWVVTSGNVDVLTLPESQFRFTFNAFDGNQALDLNGDISGAIQQDFPTTPGATYLLQFAYADNPVASGVSTASVTVTDVATSGTLLSDSISHSTSTRSDADWQTYSQFFVPSGTTSRISFVSTSSNTDSSGGNFLDDVTVSLAPEPASVAVLPVVFGLLRRQRARVVKGQQKGTSRISSIRPPIR